MTDYYEWDNASCDFNRITLAEILDQEGLGDIREKADMIVDQIGIEHCNHDDMVNTVLEILRLPEPPAQEEKDDIEIANEIFMSKLAHEKEQRPDWKLIDEMRANGIEVYPGEFEYFKGDCFPVMRTGYHYWYEDGDDSCWVPMKEGDEFNKYTYYMCSRKGKIQMKSEKKQEEESPSVGGWDTIVNTGWRLLNEGEIIENGDESWSRAKEDWIRSSDVGLMHGDQSNLPRRRRLRRAISEEEIEMGESGCNVPSNIGAISDYDNIKEINRLRYVLKYIKHELNNPLEQESASFHKIKDAIDNGLKGE